MVNLQSFKHVGLPCAISFKARRIKKEVNIDIFKKCVFLTEKNFAFVY